MKRPILPSGASQALAGIYEKMKSGRSFELELRDALDELEILPPDNVGRVDGEISALCGFWHRNSGLIWPLLGAVPRFELLSLFHQDGFVRQAALERIERPLTAPFWFAAVAYRLNDCAEPVRAAAVRCAERCFPQTDATVIAKAAPRLLERMRDWRRWTSEGSVLDAAFGRADVAEVLSKHLAVATPGPLGLILTQALRSETMDEYLVRLSQDAVQPAVRAVSLRALVRGPGNLVGRISSSLGRQDAGQDAARTGAQRTGTLTSGARDRSPIVRKLAADGLIEFHRQIVDADRVIEMLSRDRNRAIPVRMAYLIRARQL